ncbi:MAG: tRNA lysidine(34) synthetase TilS [Armatimonadota bacterium]|nr:tRNA lysidine(34) synthetase TilS [Armatimonadota bacterium]MDW8155173.1 tRNA lysidine(34) synthetase TilS [Armatimonadota bacterium]
MATGRGAFEPSTTHRRLLETVRRTVEDHRLIPPGTRVLAACSGGADSVALVHLLSRLSGEGKWEVAVGHVNHGLRPAAEEDAAFVADLARRMQLPFFVRRLHGLGAANLEARARTARYAALAELAREAGAQVVATAHTLDDQAETVLLRLLRGTGVTGLAGILPSRPVAHGIQVVRPLLWCRRQALREFLADCGESWREDETNLDPQRARNRVRHHLLPALVAESPRLVELLGQLAEVVREEEVVWAEWVHRTFRELAQPGDGGWRVSLPRFLQLPVALQRRLLRQLAGNFRAGSFVHVEEARRLLRTGQAGQELTLPGGLRVRRESGSFWVGRVGGPAAGEPAELAVPGRVVSPELGVMVEAAVEPRATFPRQGRWEAELDERWAHRRLVVRSRQPGDRIRLNVGTRKLQDLLVDLKVPRWVRDHVPVLATEEGEVLWVVGYRVADGARPAPDAARCLRVRAWPLEAGPSSDGERADGILGEQLPAGGSGRRT